MHPPQQTTFFFCSEFQQKFGNLDLTYFLLNMNSYVTFLFLIIIQICQPVKFCSEFKKFVPCIELILISIQMCQFIRVYFVFRSANCSKFRCKYFPFVPICKVLFHFNGCMCTSLLQNKINSWAYCMHNIIYYSPEHVNIC